MPVTGKRYITIAPRSRCWCFHYSWAGAQSVLHKLAKTQTQSCPPSLTELSLIYSQLLRLGSPLCAWLFSKMSFMNPGQAYIVMVISTYPGTIYLTFLSLSIKWGWQCLWNRILNEDQISFAEKAENSAWYIRAKAGGGLVWTLALGSTEVHELWKRWMMRTGLGSVCWSDSHMAHRTNCHEPSSASAGPDPQPCPSPGFPGRKRGKWRHWAGWHLHSKRTELQPPVRWDLSSPGPLVRGPGWAWKGGQWDS